MTELAPTMAGSLGAAHSGQPLLPLDLHQAIDAAFAALSAAVEWREALRLAEAALAHAADVHQGIEPGSTKAEHRRVTALEAAARTARDRFDVACSKMLALRQAHGIPARD